MEIDLSELRTYFTDLLDARLGGRAIECSDQWFAGCENLVNPDPPIYKDRHFISTGQWMDGWESRRSFERRARTSDHDWCVLRLGAPGTIFALNIDTSHFRGNAPEHVAVDGAWQPVGEETDLNWFELLPPSAIEPDSPNYFRVMSDQLASHLRLKIFPDGGVARLRAFGEVRLAREQFAEDELIDLASLANGSAILLAITASIFLLLLLDTLGTTWLARSSSSVLAGGRLGSWHLALLALASCGCQLCLHIWLMLALELEL